MEKIPEEVQLGRLERIFHNLARNSKAKVYRERKHAKFEGWFYRVEYDYCGKESLDVQEDIEILEFYGDENFSFRHELKHKDKPLSNIFIGYRIRRAYFEESMGFLKSLDIKIAQTLTERDLWKQADEKNTLVSTSISIPDFDEVYQFIKEHIRYTV